MLVWKMDVSMRPLRGWLTQSLDRMDLFEVGFDTAFDRVGLPEVRNADTESGSVGAFARRAAFG